MSPTAPRVIYVKSNSLGDYYVVATERERPVMVRRSASYPTTICFTCPGAWQGRVARGDGTVLERDGCEHTARVERAVSEGNFSTTLSDLHVNRPDSER